VKLAKLSPLLVPHFGAANPKEYSIEMPIDYKEYHPRWHQISLFIRKYRAGWRCEWCGAENGKPHPDTGSAVVLTVAHIDQDKGNNRFHNLAALCQRCHLNHDRDHHRTKQRRNRAIKKGQPDLFDTELNRQLTERNHLKTSKE